jgi:hypothetical protein
VDVLGVARWSDCTGCPLPHCAGGLLLRWSGVEGEHFTAPSVVGCHHRGAMSSLKAVSTPTTLRAPTNALVHGVAIAPTRRPARRRSPAPRDRSRLLPLQIPHSRPCVGHWLGLVLTSSVPTVPPRVSQDFYENLFLSEKIVDGHVKLSLVSTAPRRGRALPPHPRAVENEQLNFVPLPEPRQSLCPEQILSSFLTAFPFAWTRRAARGEERRG